jgi:hypothetical protein
MYSGEQLMKIVTCAFIAGLKDNLGTKGNDQYSNFYNLVRSDSIGVWSTILENIITGPSFLNLREEFKIHVLELSNKNINPSWQFGALVALNNCLKALNDTTEEIPLKPALKLWFQLFVRLRNDARAHGIPSSDSISKICPNLETSIKLISENLSLFNIPWFYLKQNISGSYRFTNLNDGVKIPEIITNSDTQFLKDGVYIYLGEPILLELFESSIEAIDFYLPNGNFTDQRYECLSYITGKKIYKESSPYLKPPGQLPSSETEGLSKLGIINHTFTNLPHVQSIYINRIELEKELERVLMMADRYPIVTLSGRGGIGKTSLALYVLQNICKTNKYLAVIWLSARDIDLLEEGPKTVKPQILDEKDIAHEFSKLLDPSTIKEKEFDAKKYMEKELREAGKDTNGPILFVMDNFETLRNPKQVFLLLDTHIRNPNKVLITSRLRDFKADFPITVEGMNRDEFNELVEKIADKLSIQKLLNRNFMDELYKESDGHPYVVKVMLGEVSKQKELKNVKRVIAGKDEILTALFERTYSVVSTGAKRIFMTLCSWRNIFPEIAIEAILNREGNELIKVEEAIEELHRYSFIELLKSPIDDSVYISVPLTAFEFGKKKLSVNPLKSKIQSDIEYLYYFGVTQFSDINKSIRPKIEYFFKNIAIAIKREPKSFEIHLPILEFICRRIPSSWASLASIYIELDNLPKAIESLQNYVADHRINGKEKVAIWEMLYRLYSLQKNYNGVAQSLVEMCNIDEIEFNDLNNAVHNLMNLFKEQKTNFKREEKQLLLESIAKKISQRIKKGEGTTSAYTELAWVYIYLNKKSSAKILTKQALERNPNSIHAINLRNILRIT